jgi:hypothetical protein
MNNSSRQQLVKENRKQVAAVRCLPAVKCYSMQSRLQGLSAISFYRTHSSASSNTPNAHSSWWAGDTRHTLDLTPLAAAAASSPLLLSLWWLRPEPMRLPPRCVLLGAGWLWRPSYVTISCYNMSCNMSCDSAAAAVPGCAQVGRWTEQQTHTVS